MLASYIINWKHFDRVAYPLIHRSVYYLATLVVWVVTTAAWIWIARLPFLNAGCLLIGLSFHFDIHSQLFSWVHRRAENPGCSNQQPEGAHQSQLGHCCFKLQMNSK